MPDKPAPIKKSPAKKAAEKAPEGAPEPQPAPEPATPPEAPPAEAPAAEAPPAEALPAEAPPAEAPPAEAPGAEAPGAEGPAATEAPADEAPAAEGEAAPAAPAEGTPAAEESAPDAEEGAHSTTPAEADAPAAEDGVAAPAADPPTDDAPVEAAVVEEPPKAPTPPPPAVPTSAPLEVSVEDVNNSSLTINWKTPETIGDSGLDGYLAEYRKDGTTDWVVAQEELTLANRLCIKNLTSGDLLHVRVVAVNPGGRSEPGTLAEPVPIRNIDVRPKIRLPRALKSRYVGQVGEQINLVIPFLGKPKPVVSWLKDGQPLDPKVNIRNSDKDSILFIRSGQREDSGVYEITIKLDSFEDKTTITLQIVERPGPPASVKLVDNWDIHAALEWTPPEDNGNTNITGYIVQKSDRKTGEWYTVLDNYRRLSATITGLIKGHTYGFRVFAQNRVGVSEQCAVTKEVAIVQKRASLYNPSEYQERNFNEAPQFTIPLSDHAATVGYSTRLLCSVRGCPKPKIEWLKNQLVIDNDPKFRQLFNQGICSLEIRKPRNFEAGVYICRATNDLGEATVSCKLEVKQIIVEEIDNEKGK